MMPFYVYQLSIKVAGYTITLRHRCTNTWATHVMAENQGSKRRLWTSSPTPSPVNVQGQPVEVTDQFTYLGSAISSSGRSAPEIHRRIGLASSIMGQLANIRRQEKLCLSTKLRLYDAFVVCVLLHGAETLTLLTSEEQKLEAFNMSCQRRIYTRNLLVRLRHQRHHHKPDWPRKCS